MKNSLETRLGVFVVLAVFAAIFIIEIIGGTDVFQRGYRVSAQGGLVLKREIRLP